jgi:deazaflavin-dependent oxidoreductase (nitroreductase family)
VTRSSDITDQPSQGHGSPGTAGERVARVGDGISLGATRVAHVLSKGIVRSYSALLRRFGRTRFFQFRVMPLMTRLDRYLYPRTNGRVLSTWPARLPTVLLTTTGRTSGSRRSFPLYAVADGESGLLATTVHGDWSQNLLATPRATVRWGRRQAIYRARLASEPERDRAWPRFTAVWPGYDDYRARSGRADVFVLEPELDPSRDAPPNRD